MKTFWIFLLPVSLALTCSVIPFRMDLTQDQRYTLSSITERILEEITTPITITAYFTEDLPPNLKVLIQDALYLLEEYQIRSGGKVVYRVINPNESPEKEREAQVLGISPLLIAVEEKDKVQQKKAYLGLAIYMGEKHEVIPVIPLDGTLEYQITSALRRLVNPRRTPVGYLTGHREHPLSDLQAFSQAISSEYSLHEVNLADSPLPVLDTFPVILWVQPRDTLPASALQKILSYLKQGGQMIFLYDPAEGNLNTRYIQKARNADQILRWLRENLGVEVEPRVLVDIQCATVMVQQRQGFLVLSVPLPFPYFPLLTSFAEHPITKGLEQVQTLFASPVSMVRPDFAFHPLAFTSNRTGVEELPAFIDIERQWTEEDFPLNQLPVVALIEDTVSGMRMVLIGDGDLIVSQNRQPPPPDNIALVASALEYLSAEEGLAQLRTQTITARPLRQLSDSHRQFVKILNVVFPVLMVILIGLGWSVYRRRSLQWKKAKILS